MRIEQPRLWQSSKPVLVGLGVVLVGGTLIWGLADGISLYKIVLAVMGLVLLAVALLGSKVVNLYRATALVMLNLLVLFLFLELAATVLLFFIPSRPQLDKRANLSYYRSQEWNEAYWIEYDMATREVYAPYVVWERPPFAGEYINVDDRGIRRTPGSECDQEAYTVFTFGGSTMWGDGVPDWDTIPAYVQSELDTLHDMPICVVNMGEIGWVSTQSTIELIHQLQMGNVPDLVIFYDGGNDVTAAWEFGEAGGHFNATNIGRRVERHNLPNPFGAVITQSLTFRLLLRLIPSLSVLRSTDVPNEQQTFDNETMADQIVDAYLANYHTVKGLSAEYGFQYAFFWQPVILVEDKLPTDEEKQFKEEFAALPGIENLHKLVYERVKEEATKQDHLYYIADVLNGLTEGIYLDNIHITPFGNQLVAHRIVQILTEQSLVSTE